MGYARLENTATCLLAMMAFQVGHCGINININIPSGYLT
jgi:hypothetical protein